MFQIPSQDWPRRTLPLTGGEDFLKQNPTSDTAPQEERVPGNLISDFVISNISLLNVGSGTSIISSKVGGNFNFRTVGPTSSRISIGVSSNTVLIDANAAQIAASISLSDIGDVIDTPITGDFLQFNGASWVTAPVINEIYLEDGTNTETLNGTNNVLTFQATANITPTVSPTNVITLQWAANIADLSDVPAPTNSDQVLSWDGSTYSWEDFSTVVSTAVTDGQNVGNQGQGVFSNKLGTILRFRNVAPASNKITITLSGNNILFEPHAVNIANEIKLTDLLDVTGTPMNGDTIVYNSGSNNWVSTNLSTGGWSLQVYDENFLFNTFNNSTYLRIFGGANISTDYTNSQNLRINWSADLEEIDNVNISTPTHGQVLVYNASGTTWENADFGFEVNGNSGTQLIKNGEKLKLLGQNGITINVVNPDTALIKLDASITNLNDIDAPTGANQLLLWNGTQYEWTNQSNISGNLTASNVGTLGTGVFKQKTGSNLEFRNIASNSSKINVLLDVNNNITIDAVPIEIAEEIRLQDLLDVTNTPSTDGYLKFNGTTWITETISAPTSFQFTIEADTGIDNVVLNNDTYIFSGNNEYIFTENYLSGSTKETQIKLDLNKVSNDIDLQDLGNIFGTPNPNDTLFFDGTKFIFQALPTTTFSNAWLLGGNNETSQYSFGTLSNFDIPILANNVQVGIIKTSGRFGWGVNNPLSTFDSNGSVGLGNVSTQTANYTATSTDYMILVDATAGDITITLPSASGIYRREYIVKKIDTSDNVVNITSATLIDDNNTYSIYSSFVAIKLKSNGTQWYIF